MGEMTFSIWVFLCFCTGQFYSRWSWYDTMSNSRYSIPSFILYTLIVGIDLLILIFTVLLWNYVNISSHLASFRFIFLAIDAFTITLLYFKFKKKIILRLILLCIATTFICSWVAFVALDAYILINRDDDDDSSGMTTGTGLVMCIGCSLQVSSITLHGILIKYCFRKSKIGREEAGNESSMLLGWMDTYPP